MPGWNRTSAGLVRIGTSSIPAAGTITGVMLPEGRIAREPFPLLTTAVPDPFHAVPLVFRIPKTAPAL